MAGRLTLEQRAAVVHRAMPELGDRPIWRLVVECLDVEIVLAGGRLPGMLEETRKRILEEARALLGSEEASAGGGKGN